MCTSVLVLSLAIISAQSVTVHRVTTEIITKSHMDLTSISIQCKITDILIISVPIIVGERARYFLYNPRGEPRELNISVPQYQTDIHDYDTMSVKFIKGRTVIAPMDKIKIFNVNDALFLAAFMKEQMKNEFAESVKNMQSNDFLLGPVGEDDHGNWIISAVYKDEEGEWAAINQHISICIFEVVPAVPRKPLLHVGDTFELRLAYPIKYLETCELIVPRTTFDRFYDRSKLRPETCGYVIENVTLSDEGIWKIVAVGRIVYEAFVQLTVTNDTATSTSRYHRSVLQNVGVTTTRRR